MKLILSASVFAALSNKAVDAAGVGTFFTYYEEGGLGPSNWAFLAIEGNECGGMQGTTGFGQSPVTISHATEAVCDTDMSAYEFTGGDCKWEDLDFTISNNGVKVAPKADADCGFGNMNIPHSDQSFNALQYHIHTYSEHQITGQGDDGFFPAELHVVHQIDTGDAEYAVFGTMIDVDPDDDQEHEVFEMFLQGWEAAAQVIDDSCPEPESAERFLRALGDDTVNSGDSIVQEKVQCSTVGNTTWGPTEIDWPDESPNVYELPTNPDFGVFTYKGGLTTPGCNELVNWNLLDTPMIISQNQLERLEALILCYVAQEVDDDNFVQSCQHATVADKAGSTSRPPQDLLGRNVIHRCPDGPARLIDDVGVEPIVDDFEKPEPREENPNTKEGKCDEILFKDCGTDPRYNPNVSPNIKAGASSWAATEGFWIGTKKAFDARGNPLEPEFASSAIRNSLPYSREDVLMFMNRTIVETRYYEHIYVVYLPAPLDFCLLPVPDDAANVLGDGKCGETGHLDVGERFGTATYEKDGTVDLVHTNGRFEGATHGEAIPIGDRSFYRSVGSEEFRITDTESFTNDEQTLISGSGQYFVFSDVLPYSENPLSESFTYSLQQVHAEDWIVELATAFDDAGILDDERYPIVLRSSCAIEDNCITDDEFAKTDPALTEGPYEEDPDVKGGFIALFVIIGVLLLFAAVFVFHTVAMKNQAERYKAKFADRIATTVRVRSDKMTPESLEAEFKKMDTDGNGTLDKDEMHRFMGDVVDERDFEAMFAAMDIDNNENIDFAEFCAFLKKVDFKNIVSETSSDENKNNDK